MRIVPVPLQTAQIFFLTFPIPQHLRHVKRLALIPSLLLQYHVRQITHNKRTPRHRPTVYTQVELPPLIPPWKAGWFHTSREKLKLGFKASPPVGGEVWRGVKSHATKR